MLSGAKKLFFIFRGNPDWCGVKTVVVNGGYETTVLFRRVVMSGGWEVLPPLPVSKIRR